MTLLEQRAVTALARCRLLPGSWNKRFIRSLGGQPTLNLSPKQSSCLWKLVRHYRRQLPGELVGIAEGMMDEATWLASINSIEMLQWITSKNSTNYVMSGRKQRLYDDALLSHPDMSTPATILSGSAVGVASALLRDIVGNPFRKWRCCTRCGPVPSAKVYPAEGGGFGHTDCWQEVVDRPIVPASWLAWQDGTVRRLAQQIYDERAFDRLPILADAMEDSGCADRSILDHLRGVIHVRCPEDCIVPSPRTDGIYRTHEGGGPESRWVKCGRCNGQGVVAQMAGVTHCRGCWAVDLLLGKE